MEGEDLEEAMGDLKAKKVALGDRRKLKAVLSQGAAATVAGAPPAVESPGAAALPAVPVAASPTAGGAMSERVRNVPQVTRNLGPIWGWQEAALVSLERATAKLPVKGIAVFVRAAMLFAQEFKRTHPNDKRSIHQIGAVYLYTMGWAVSADSLYAVLNNTLDDEERSHLVVWFMYLKLLFTALDLEPCYVGMLWRGVNKNISAAYAARLFVSFARAGGKEEGSCGEDSVFVFRKTRFLQSSSHC